MKYTIIKTSCGYGVVNENGKRIITNETMAVCDAVIFARTVEPKTIYDVTEFMEEELCRK